MVPMFQDKARELTALFEHAIEEDGGVVERKWASQACVAD